MRGPRLFGARNFQFPMLWVRKFCTFPNGPSKIYGLPGPGSRSGVGAKSFFGHQKGGAETFLEERNVGACTLCHSTQLSVDHFSFRTSEDYKGPFKIYRVPKPGFGEFDSWKKLLVPPPISQAKKVPSSTFSTSKNS